MIEVFLWGIKLKINFFYLKIGGYVVRGCVCASHNTGFICVFSVWNIFFNSWPHFSSPPAFLKRVRFPVLLLLEICSLSNQSCKISSLAISIFPYISRTNSNIFPMIGTKYFLLLEMLLALIRIFWGQHQCTRTNPVCTFWAKFWIYVVRWFSPHIHSAKC